MGQLQLEGKLVWITGASSGIGRELALIAAISGARVILSSSTYEKLEKVWNECRIINPHCYMRLLDLSVPADIPEVVDFVLKKYGPVDVLINNGGISQRSLITETSEETIRKVMEIDFFGPALLTKAILPSMIANGGGHIAVTSSFTGLFGFPLRCGYCAAKHALNGFFETVRAEHFKDRINVTIVCPGRINTPISKSAVNGEGKSHGVMDPGQANGMPARECALQYMKAIRKNKKLVIIGRADKIMPRLKRFFPSLFYFLLKKVKPT